MIRKLIQIALLAVAISMILLWATTSVWQPVDPEDVVRPATRPYEFDYFAWTTNAFWDKVSMAGLGINHYLTFHQDREIIKRYYKLLDENQDLKSQIENLFSDPEIQDPEAQTAELRQELNTNQQQLDDQASLAEAVIQKQIAATLDDLGLTSLNQPFPPVLYHGTELPKELILSKRDVIEQVASVSLNAGITLEEIVALEDKVEADTDFSALVVDIGGVGTYPTMVIQTGSFSYMINTVAHEWTHNYLNLRPLGNHYGDSPELRTMNETTASISGEEVSQAVLRNFYADLLDTPDSSPTPYKTYDVRYNPETQELQEDTFSYRQEMYKTRVHVDELLAAGEIDEAEQYMEDQRQVFWNNGYSIRKLNQAYFAFHGAYADQEYSAAGADPVGDAVRKLRAHSDNLADFINKMSTFSSYDQLAAVVNAY